MLSCVVRREAQPLRRQALPRGSQSRQRRPPRDPRTMAGRSADPDAEEQARAGMSTATRTSHLAPGAGRRQDDRQSPPALALPATRSGRVQEGRAAL